MPDYMIRAGRTYYFARDHLGSVRYVIDVDDQSIAQVLRYDEFGQVTFDSNPGFQPFGFAGGLYDEDTGLTRFGVRDYEARTGRWTARDPIGFGGGQANLYVYAGNDSVNYIDPGGDAAQVVAAGAILGGVAGGLIYAATTDNFTGLGLAGAVLGGAVTGGIAVVAAPIASSLGLGGGAVAIGAVNFTGGALGTTISDAFDPCREVSLAGSAFGGALGAVGGGLGRHFFPTTGMRTFAQMRYFAPRTLRGFVPTTFGGKAGPNAINVYSAFATSGTVRFGNASVSTLPD